MCRTVKTEFSVQNFDVEILLARTTLRQVGPCTLCSPVAYVPLGAAKKKKLETPKAKPKSYQPFSARGNIPRPFSFPSNHNITPKCDLKHFTSTFGSGYAGAEHPPLPIMRSPDAQPAAAAVP